jgi:hypothetical protein
MRGSTELLTGLTKKNMVDSMRWVRKIGEGILANQKKEKRK